MNISEVSERLAQNVSAELNYDEDKKEIIAYGIESIILSIVGFTAILVVAFFLKALIPAIIATIFGGALRKVSGGAHFNSPFKCLAFGTVVYPVLGIVSMQITKYELYSTSLGLLILVICLLIVALLAPVDSEAKPIHSPSFRNKLKIASIIFMVLACLLILFSNNTLLNTGAVLGIIYQTVTLLPVFNKKKEEVSL